MLASDDSNMVTTVLVTLLFAGFLAVCGAMVVQMLRADEAAFARRLEQRMPQVQAKHIRVDVGLAQLYTGGRIQVGPTQASHFPIKANALCRSTWTGESCAPSAPARVKMRVLGFILATSAMALACTRRSSKSGHFNSECAPCTCRIVRGVLRHA
jgi:hypothetical protein